MKRHIFKAIHFPTKKHVSSFKNRIPGEQAQHEAVHGGLRQPQGHHAAAEQAAQVRRPLAGGKREAQRIPSNYHYYKTHHFPGRCQDQPRRRRRAYALPHGQGKKRKYI